MPARLSSGRRSMSSLPTRSIPTPWACSARSRGSTAAPRIWRRSRAWCRTWRTRQPVAVLRRAVRSWLRRASPRRRRLRSSVPATPRAVSARRWSGWCHDRDALSSRAPGAPQHKRSAVVRRRTGAHCTRWVPVLQRNASRCAAPGTRYWRGHIMTALLEVEGLVKHFVAARSVFGRPTAHVKAVDGVSFTVEAGKTLALVGESGCGKSTVSRLVLRLIEPDAGTVRFEGRDLGALNANDLRAFRRDAHIIFQDPYASLNPRMTVSQILTEPLALHDLVPAARRRERVEELLRLVGLEPRFARRYPHEFSGGQRQRIAIARALAVEPKLIICDEPVSALDVSIRSQILNLLRDLQDRL